MRKLAGVFLVVVVLLLTMGGVASGANSSASCNGILVSSLAGQAGVGELTRGFHQEFKDAGIPPGFFDAAGAQEHGGDVETCLGA